jgi:hypothetical protein
LVYLIVDILEFPDFKSRFAVYGKERTEEFSNSRCISVQA